MAAATQERRLLGVGSTAGLGGYVTPTMGSRSLGQLAPPESPAYGQTYRGTSLVLRLTHGLQTYSKAKWCIRNRLMQIRMCLPKGEYFHGQSSHFNSCPKMRCCWAIECNDEMANLKGGGLEDTWLKCGSLK